MKPKTFQRLRSLHRWLGLFFAPMIILFAITGLLQVIGADDWNTPNWLYNTINALENAHQHQYLRQHTLLHQAAEVFAVALALTLILTPLLGIALAYKMFPRKRLLITIVIVLGILIPVLVMVV